ncbi:MAG: hypothetical protein M3Q57_05225, partial [Pseudomonadota bacterium]|nr:hypothetical protein [Pseudomonadota bacterium]
AASMRSWSVMEMTLGGGRRKIITRRREGARGLFIVMPGLTGIHLLLPQEDRWTPAQGRGDGFLCAFAPSHEKYWSS